ncbi:hypothetical protein SAMN05444157_0753 [Frankineae bacterium MT45]|nr:hypothetical protein SAMN05444157_0753 [Frankineae bacterium MT45]
MHFSEPSSGRNQAVRQFGFTDANAHSSSIRESLDASSTVSLRSLADVSISELAALRGDRAISAVG